ncbi:formate/nitrite transporter family protein [Tissierella praeacuta]|uniref:formate/nitrite transporter family protein n=1 Tax=Tissierella praeacuta TaxID=43131 RepID=UPI0028AF4B3F|nr:formate/nitrite transporter family protein [Tissierella praeacuta]
MEKRFLAPSEVAKSIIASAETKVSLSITRLITLGIMAGTYIGFGAFGNIVIMQTLGNIDIGLMKFLGSSVFPVGLMLVVFSGSELFTGNNLMTMALMDRKISIKGLLKNWSLVYLGNFIGSLILAYLIYKSQLVNKDILNITFNISSSKTALSFQVAFIRGLLCNILVCLAVWMAASAQDIISRIFTIWFPIMLFVLSGYEHSIANMFFLSLGKYCGLNITWSNIWFSNLIPVTLGNIVGGGLIIPIAYYITYILPAKND